MLWKTLSLVAAGAVIIATLVPLTGNQKRVRRDLLVAAAASLSQLAPQLSHAVHESEGVEVRFNFAASNTLARQILEGARVDVFISADSAQMDAVGKAGRLADQTRFDLLGNQLMVVLASPYQGTPETFRPPHLAHPAVRRLALGDPAAVPVGVYARQWLERVGLWRDVAGKVIPLPSSRAVLGAVREGRADAGIVYVTDGAAGYVVPGDEAPPIRYPAAAVAGARVEEARVFLNFLRSPEAARIFKQAGFTHLP